MGPQYKREELLRLRDSPLVSKPASLPPVEEWMGPQQEQAQRRTTGARGKQEGSFGNDSHTRPTLLETRHMSRTSGNVPSDIVLGPPKTAFASASTPKSPRQYDSPSRSAFGNFGGDGSRGDYFGQRGKYSGDREGKDEKSKDSNSSKSRFDLERWSGPRSARNLATEEEGPSRRPGDRESTESSTDFRDVRKTGYKNQEAFRREGEDNRRNGAGRGFKPSWAKDDESPGTPRENNAENIRSREWREGDRGPRRGGERDWSRVAKAEQDPEWMAEEKPQAKKERHTTEDIEQWKADMRAKTKGIQEEAASDKEAHHFRSTSGSIVPKTKLDTPLATMDNGIDTFFNIWDQAKGEQGATDQGLDSGLKPQNVRQAAPKSSRFTGFFSPKPTDTAKGADVSGLADQSAAPNVQTTGESALQAYNAVFDEPPSDDRAGFERMLQMLRNPRSEAEEPRPGQAPAVVGQGPNLEDKQNPELLLQHQKQSPPVLSPRSQRAHGFESLLGPQSPHEPPPTYNKDTEFLLNLLRKDDTWKQSFPHIARGRGDNAPGILPHPNLMAQFQSQRSEENDQNPFPEDQPLEHHRPIDKLNPTASVSRSQRQPAPFEEHEDPSHFPPPSHMSNANIPPGFQRPPGFDHPAPPSFPAFVSPQQPNPRGGPMGPPPGFPTPSRNPNPGQFPPGLGPRMANLNLSGPSDRGPPIGMGPGGPGGPTGPGPYMGGPPPFPPHSAGFPMMGPGGGGGPFGTGPGGRPPMDMPFGNGNGDFGMNGGGGRGAGAGGGLGGPPPLAGHFTRQE